MITSGASPNINLQGGLMETVVAFVLAFCGVAVFFGVSLIILTALSVICENYEKYKEKK
jgi:hypothetical protein